MSILDDKSNEGIQHEGIRQKLKEEAEIVLHPAEITAGYDLLPKANCSDEERRKTSEKENGAKTESVSKGEDFVWRPGLTGLEYLANLILPICFTKQYLDRFGKTFIRQ